MPWDTRNDFISLLEVMIEYEDYTSSVVCKKLGWNARRFNPALTCIIEYLPERLLRNVNQWEYSVHGLLSSPETLAHLKRILNDNKIK
jgi:hypothetical protein